MSADVRILARVLGGVLVATCVAIVPARAQDDAALTHARALLRTVPLIDGHNDLPWEIRTSKTAPMDVQAYNLNAQTLGNTDIPRLRAGRGAAPSSGRSTSPARPRTAATPGCSSRNSTSPGG